MKIQITGIVKNKNQGPTDVKCVAVFLPFHSPDIFRDVFCAENRWQTGGEFNECAKAEKKQLGKQSKFPLDDVPVRYNH